MYVSPIILQCFPLPWRIETRYIPNSKSYVHFPSLGSLKKTSEAKTLYDSSWHVGFLRRGVVSLTSNPQAGGPLLTGCRRMLMDVFVATLYISVECLLN
jgi:hypothetical protein